MGRLSLGVALAVILAVAACDSDTIPPTTAPGTRDTLVPGGPRQPFPPGGGSDGGGGDTLSTPPAGDTTGAGDPIANGLWISQDGSTAALQAVDPLVFDTSGTGTAGASGSSTALVFATTGSGLFGFGTCGVDALWTDPGGSVFGPNNPNCIAYRSDAGAGNEGTGQCAVSVDGFPGLWIDPNGQATHPFNAECAVTGLPTTTLVLSFSAPGQLYEAHNTSGSRALNFFTGGLAQAQLLYDGPSDVTTGAGILVGSDNASPAHVWTVYFGQPALSYTGGLENGDLIGAMTTTGVRAVACSTTIGCSLVTLKLAATS
jgi:hypothetical protein